MKKLLILLVLTLSVSLNAQSSSKDELAIIQSSYGKSKTDLVNVYMALSPAQTKAFQPVYDSYEAERKVLGQKKIQIIDEYAAKYATLTDADADQLTKANLKNNLEVEKLYDKTYEKAKKVIGATNAAKFIQLEIYLQTTIRGEIQDSIPFIDEIDKTNLN
jgi:methanogenic corrinoid protein MtbC1